MNSGIMKIKLVKLAHARSGDKGDTANVGLIALREEILPAARARGDGGARQRALRRDVPRRGRALRVAESAAPQFLLHESLGGGGTLSLMTDAQGKTFSTALLRMDIEVPDEVARSQLIAVTSEHKIKP